MARPLSGKAGQFGAAGPGKRRTYKHPERGSLSAAILGSIHYAELWQRRKAPSEPWIPTGNIFTAHWLGDTLLYHWKDRLYVLDSYDIITDVEISQQILPAPHHDEADHEKEHPRLTMSRCRSRRNPSSPSQSRPNPSCPNRIRWNPNPPNSNPTSPSSSCPSRSCR